MDVNALGGGGGGGGALPALVVVEGAEYRITHPYHNDAVGGYATSLNGFGGDNPATGEWFLFDPATATLSKDPALPYPIGFDVASDGSINYGQTPTDAFPNVDSSIRMIVTGQDGAKGVMILQSA